MLAVDSVGELHSLARPIARPALLSHGKREGAGWRAVLGGRRLEAVVAGGFGGWTGGVSQDTDGGMAIAVRADAARASIGTAGHSL
jgi:hypothetical protein